VYRPVLLEAPLKVYRDYRASQGFNKRNLRLAEYKFERYSSDSSSWTLPITLIFTPGRKVRLFLSFLLIVLLFLNAGCALKKEVPSEPVWTAKNSLLEIPPQQLSDMGDSEELISSIDLSLRFLNKRSEDTLYQFGTREVPLMQVKETLLDLRARILELGLGQELFDYIEKNYEFYQSAATRVLFTGYFEASLNGAREKSERYHYPLYAVPDDLVRIDLKDFIDTEKHPALQTDKRGKLKDKRLVPYYSREDIDSRGKLADKGLEIIWVDDSVAAFFLHIQGSGIVYLEDGSSLRVNYADKNGHPYRALGRLLIDQGKIKREDVSMQSIVSYLKQNPEEVEELLNYNPSYIFFRELDEGPIGSIGVALTPMRSIATDYRLFPRGALAFVKTQLPVYGPNGEIQSWTEFSALVLNQDTGGAIRGAGRVDLFTGHGESSELLAGPLKEEGELIFLLKKSDKN